MSQRITPSYRIMVAGVTRLSAYGREDFYLSYKPQITFWKIIYKRHTFFTFEAIEQNFVTRPDFGSSYTSILSAHGDLITDLILILKLPPITPNPPLQFRWVESVGAAVIKKVEFEINGVIIDTFTGEWIRIWQELCGLKKRPSSDGSHRRGLLKMLGEHQDFQDSMEGRTIYVPIPFWFTRSPGQAFPIASLNTHEVRINLEFEILDRVLQYGPTHSITVLEYQVYFKHGSYLRQGTRAMGIFFRFDASSRTLYYNPVFGQFQEAPSDTSKYYTPHLLESDDGLFCTPTSTPTDSGLSQSLPYSLRQRFHLGQGTTLLTQYIFLGREEKQYFGQRRHDYVIEQIQSFYITNLQRRQNIRILARRPSSQLVWVAKNTTSSLACGFPFHYQNDPRDPFLHTSILSKCRLLMNSLQVWSDESDGDLQLFMHHPPTRERLPGIHVYSFAINPTDPQPSGSVNLSHIERIYLDLFLNENVTEPIMLNVYVRSYNVLVIERGMAQLIF